MGQTTKHFECNGENLYKKALKIGLAKIRSGEYNPTYKMRRAQLNFDMIDYKPGKEIWFKPDRRFSCKVVDFRHVEFEGRRDWTLFELTTELFLRIGKSSKRSSGPSSWVDENGVSLKKLREKSEKIHGKTYAKSSIELKNRIG